MPEPASEKLTIDTPEQIALEFPLASAGSRFLAIAIDTLIQVAAFALLVLVATTVLRFWVEGGGALGMWLLATLVIVAFVLYYGYYAAFEALWNGQTPGKRMVGLRVMTASGRPISPYDSLLRNLLRIVDQLPGIYTVGLVAIFLSDRNQRLGDLAADTVVVHERPMESGTAIPVAVKPGIPATSAYASSRLSDQELAVIETFLSRRDALNDSIRRRSARKLADRVRTRLQIASHQATDDEALLERVAAEARGGWR